MKTESQAPLLETDTVRGIEAGLLALKVPFPTLMAAALDGLCAGQSCPRFICVYSWSLEMQSLLGTVS